MTHTLARGGRRALTTNPRMLSLREAAVLANVLEKEPCVRKDMDAGVFAVADVFDLFKTCRRFDWSSVVVFAAVYGNSILIDSRSLRAAAVSKIYSVTTGAGNIMNSWMCPGETVYIDKYLTIPLGLVCEDVKPRIDLYRDGLSRVEEKDAVMGGAAVFKDTRLPVHHVGKMVEDGEAIENILEDYPYLTKDDIEFAFLYSRARPIVGRPRSGGSSGNEAFDA